MSYYGGSYYGNPQPTYDYRSYTSPSVAPLSGLNMMQKSRNESKKKTGLIVAIVLLALLLIGAIIAVIILFLKKDDTPVLEPEQVTAATITYLTVDLVATRTDQTWSSEYADATQNAYISISTTTCFEITRVVATTDYVVTDCKISAMTDAGPGIAMTTQITVFISTQTSAEALPGLSSALTTVEAPLVIDSSSIKEAN